MYSSHLALDFSPFLSGIKAATLLLVIFKLSDSKLLLMSAFLQGTISQLFLSLLLISYQIYCKLVSASCFCGIAVG